MLSIAWAVTRPLGQPPKEGVVLTMDVLFRDHLKHFKGARLGVFMAIALHADKNGIADPTIPRLAGETGYDDDTVSQAISKLLSTEILGHRVLARRQIREAGKFARPMYRIFPTKDEVAEWDADDTPQPENPDTVEQKTPKVTASRPTTNRMKAEKPKEVEPKVSTPENKFNVPIYKTKWYPVNAGKKMILNQPLAAAVAPVEKAEDWKKKGVTLISGQELKRDPKYGQYDVISLPQESEKRKPVFDALATYGFDVPKGGKPGKRTAGRIGAIISELATNMGREFNDLIYDELIERKIKLFYEDWLSKPGNSNSNKPKDIVNFPSQFLAWLNPQAKADAAASSVTSGMEVA